MLPMKAKKTNKKSSQTSQNITDTEKRNFIVDVQKVSLNTAAGLSGNNLNRAYKKALKDVEKKMVGGKVMKRKAGKKVGSDPKTGATHGTGIEGFTSGKQPKDKRRKKGFRFMGVDIGNDRTKGKVEAKSGGSLTDRNNSAIVTDSKTKTKRKVKTAKKGGIVYKKHGGVVKAAGGDDFVSSCYD